MSKSRRKKRLAMLLLVVPAALVGLLVMFISLLAVLK